MWLATLQLATQEVFELMLASVLQSANPSSSQEDFDITAIVGLAGQLRGIVSVHCSSESAVRMACRMLGVEREAAEPLMWDAMGEICNLVAGNFKNKVHGLGDKCLLSVPSVIMGANYRVHCRVAERMDIRFVFEGAPFAVCLEVHS